MNINEPAPDARHMPKISRFSNERIATEEELRSLAEDIVRYCPSLTHLLIALGSKNAANPLHGLN